MIGNRISELLEYCETHDLEVELSREGDQGKQAGEWGLRVGLTLAAGGRDLDALILTMLDRLKSGDSDHSCDAQLGEAKKRGEVVSDFRAQGGERWTCSCGRVYVHVCDEADGCSWWPAEQVDGVMGDTG